MLWIIGGIGAAVMIVGLLPSNSALVFLGVVLITGAVMARMVGGTPSQGDTKPAALAPTPAARHGDERERQLYHRLLVMARGDEGLAERLIGHEARRAPGRGRTAHIDAAIERWVRDMSR